MSREHLSYLKELGIDWYVPREARDAQQRPRAADGAVEVPLMDWDTLQRAVSGCTLCGLQKTRTQTVFGVGNRQAQWMVIGEAPGADEDAQGEPFVGRAGQLLNNMLKAIGLERSQVFIANILKCRPPNNREPTTRRGSTLHAVSRSTDRSDQAADHSGGRPDCGTESVADRHAHRAHARQGVFVRHTPDPGGCDVSPGLPAALARREAQSLD